MRIVRLANFYAPTSGGQRTALDETGRRYQERGVDTVLVVPGAADDDSFGPAGRRITLASHSLPRTPYHLLTDLRGVRHLVSDLRPDRLELSDRSTLWPVARWAAHAGLPLVLWVHERVESMLTPRLPSRLPVAAASRSWDRRTVRWVTRAVAPTEFAAVPIRDAGVPDVRVVPHGVDLETFHPSRRPPARDREPLLVWVGRLSAEKQPELAVDAVAELHRRGVTARLVMVGGGGMSGSLHRRAEGLPVTFTGHINDRDNLAQLLAAAEVAIATCPGESFGLSALEALACGTPVVAADQGGLPEVVDPSSGRLAGPTPESFADAVEDLLRVPTEFRVRLARRRAVRFSWDATVDGLLDAHEHVRRPEAVPA